MSVKPTPDLAGLKPARMRALIAQALRRERRRQHARAALVAALAADLDSRRRQRARAALVAALAADHENR